MMKTPLLVNDIARWMENWAPSALAETYDNVGLLVGKPQHEISGILVSLDATLEVLEEAKAKNCNLIISHHPILFKGLKRLNGQNYVARAVEFAIKNDLNVYACHTNLDAVKTGVNFKIGKKLGLQNLRPLLPKKEALLQLSFFTPAQNKESILEALHQAGAGNIGQYSKCSFSAPGEGRFLPSDAAQPFLGQTGQWERAEEERVEVILPLHAKNTVLKTLFEVHPYEEVAYFLTKLENEWQDAGMGMIGTLPESTSFDQFVQHIKTTFQVPVVKHTPVLDKELSTVAFCGGSGISLLPEAKNQKAQIFITADVKYHDFFDAEGQIILADIGHFESEQFTSELIVQKLSTQFPNIAVLLSETKTNPVLYS